MNDTLYKSPREKLISKTTTAEGVNDIVSAYKHLVKGIDLAAKNNKGRAYGGIVRAGKGSLVESIARESVRLAWLDLDQDESRLDFNKRVYRIPMKIEYLKRIKDEEVRQYIKQNRNKYFYTYKADVQVNIDGKMAIAIECKAYTENAMLKRVLVDFTLLDHAEKEVDPVLFQLESQLGGDYSSISKKIFGSPSSHTLISYFDIDLNIITLLEQERKVDKPIHKAKFYKSLKKESVLRAISFLKDLLKKRI